MKKCIITVVGKDKVGIIAGVCQYLSDISVNILNISQKTLLNAFSCPADKKVKKVILQLIKYYLK